MPLLLFSALQEKTQDPIQFTVDNQTDKDIILLAKPKKFVDGVEKQAPLHTVAKISSHTIAKISVAIIQKYASIVSDRIKIKYEPGITVTVMCEGQEYDSFILQAGIIHIVSPKEKPKTEKMKSPPGTRPRRPWAKELPS